MDSRQEATSARAQVLRDSHRRALENETKAKVNKRWYAEAKLTIFRAAKGAVMSEAVQSGAVSLPKYVPEQAKSKLSLSGSEEARQERETWKGLAALPFPLLANSKRGRQKSSRKGELQQEEAIRSNM